MPAAHTSSLTSKEGQTSHLLSSLQVLFKILANMWDEDPGQEQGLSGSVLLLRDGLGQILAKNFGSDWSGRDGYVVKTNLMQKITLAHSC